MIMYGVLGDKDRNLIDAKKMDRKSYIEDLKIDGTQI